MHTLIKELTMSDEELVNRRPKLDETMPVGVDPTAKFDDAPRKLGRPLKAPAAQPSPMPSNDELEARALAVREAGKVKQALSQAGIQPKEMADAKVPQQWIYNGKIKTLSPKFGNFVPVGEDDMWVYSPPSDMPVLDENLQEHLALCESRVNTVRVPDRATEISFDGNQNGVSDLVKMVSPETAEQARSRMGLTVSGGNVV
jgi:hypothetical protein